MVSNRHRRSRTSPRAVERGGEALEIGVVLSLVAGCELFHVRPEDAFELRAIASTASIVQRFGGGLGRRKRHLL